MVRLDVAAVMMEIGIRFTGRASAIPALMLFHLIQTIVELPAGFAVTDRFADRLVRAEDAGDAVLKMVGETGRAKKVSSTGFAV